MKTFLLNLRNIAISGFFFLLPLFVVFIIITKAWTALASVGANLAGIFGMKSIMGFGGTNVFTGLLMIAICLACGLLVRLPFMAALSHAIEKSLAKYIPGYDTYKALAEEKLQSKIRILPYAAALIKQHEYWQPAYVVEQDHEGNYVLFLPDIPETNKGHVLLANESLVKLMPSVTANQLDASLKKIGRGLLTECGIQLK
jgi:hypothetical protein